MTPKIRRRVFVSLLAVFLTLPAEVILLRAIATPDRTQAIQEWGASLSSDQLSAAGSQIESYPFEYRRSIFRAMTPAQRAQTWRAHIARYAKAHPELDSQAQDLLRSAQSALTAQLLSQPTAADRASIHAVADQIVATLGKDVADELLYYVGKKDTSTASAEPVMMRLTNYVRDQVTLFAASPTCDCAMSWGCQSWSQHCTQVAYCDVTDSWPACGWAWSEACDGLCAGGGA